MYNNKSIKKIGNLFINYIYYEIYMITLNLNHIFILNFFLPLYFLGFSLWFSLNSKITLPLDPIRDILSVNMSLKKSPTLISLGMSDFFSRLSIAFKTILSIN